MSRHVHEIEADSLEVAREEAAAKVPAGWQILSEEIRGPGTSVKDLGIHELSGMCDFCRARCRGEVFSAKQIASAARRGFCPGAAKRMGWSASRWQQHATTGAASETDWLVCSSCVKELRSYL